MLIDFHSHILPGIDDGAEDVSVSVTLLEALKAQGVKKVVATPHYYKQNESIADFIERRSDSHKKLMAEISGRDLPEVILGAEVLFTPYLEEDDLSPLKIGNTDYILFEMPYRHFDKPLLKSVGSLFATKGISPIMAHIERYVRFTDKEDVYKLMSYGAVGQINASSFLNMKSKKLCMEFIKNDIAQIIGTDTHNPYTRPPHMDEAIKKIEKKFGVSTVYGMMRNAEKILENTDLEEIIGTYF